MADRECVITGVLTAATTLGAIAFLGLAAWGSAAAGQLIIQDGTAIRFIVPITITGSHTIEFSAPIAFTNFNVALSASANYAVLFHSRP